MEGKRIYDILNFGEFTNKYLQENKDVNLAFGLRPSGIVHLGNLFTLALASEAANAIGPHISNLTISILDLERPDNQDWDSTSKKYVKHYPDLVCKGYSSFVERAEVQINDFMEKLSKEMTVPFSIRKLSELQRDSRYRKGLKNILDNEESRKIISPTSNKDKIEVSPLCKKCNTSYTNTIRGKMNEYNDGIIYTHCFNPSCPVEDYEVNVLDTSFDLSVHPLMGALRDLSCPVADAHVYGGDYFYPAGESKESKIEKIRKVMNIADPKKHLDFLVGPTLFSKGRDKMSKSLYNGMDYGHLKKLFGDDYVKRILDFTRFAIEKEYSLIDFAVIQENLLG